MPQLKGRFEALCTMPCRSLNAPGSLAAGEAPVSTGPTATLHCCQNQPLCTENIKQQVRNAQARRGFEAEGPKMLQLLEADSWTLDYMESRPHEFPASDASAVAAKMAEAAQAKGSSEELAMLLAAMPAGTVAPRQLCVRSPGCQTCRCNSFPGNSCNMPASEYDSGSSPLDILRCCAPLQIVLTTVCRTLQLNVIVCCRRQCWRQAAMSRCRTASRLRAASLLTRPR